MEAKSLRRIRRENIKRLEESLPPLEQKITRADLEHKYCPNADPDTGVCDVPEKRAQQLVTKFAQEHRMSSLTVTGGGSSAGGWGGGDQKSKKKKAELAADEAAAKAREKIINDLQDEGRRLENESNMTKSYIDAIDEVMRDFVLYSDKEESDGGAKEDAEGTEKSEGKGEEKSD